MAEKGGARPNAGRPKSSLNRKTVELMAGVVSQGKTPLEYLLAIMRDETADEKRRDWAADRCAAFIHPRPAPIARPIMIDLPATDTVEGITAALAKITHATASGEIAPSEAQSLSALIEAQRKAIETNDILERLKAVELIANR